MYLGGKKIILGLQASFIVYGSTWNYVTCEIISHSWNFVPHHLHGMNRSTFFFSFLNAML